MKPAKFRYHDPTTVTEAVQILGEHGDDAKPLAGGQSLVPLLALRLARFGHLVDLNRVAELSGVRREDGHLRVGAMTRQRAAERDAAVAEAAPLLARALPWIGHFQIRNRGTIGGSIAHADPASELPAVALALDAEMEVASASGTRTVPAADFFESTFTTTLDEGDLLTAIRFPVWGDGSGFAIREFARRSGDFAVAGVVAAIHASGGVVDRAAIAFLGMGSTPLRARAAEQALVGTSLADIDPEAVAAAAVAETDPSDDIHASASNRRRIAIRLAEDAVAAASNEAAGASA